VRSVCRTNTGKNLLLQKFRAARAAATPAVAAVPTLAAAPLPTGPATVQSLGQQLREVLPARRLQSVSLCDHEANVLWLSEGALGPDEHLLVTEALEILTADPSIPCHETAVEDGRLAVFLPVRAPTGSLVGVAMILADSKSVGDDTLERLTAAPIRSIMQRLAVLLKPSAALAAVTAVAHAVPLEPEEVAKGIKAAETGEFPQSKQAPRAPEGPKHVDSFSAELELTLDEPEVARPRAPVAAPAPKAPAPAADATDGLSESGITAVEIANLLELELAPEDEAHPAPAAGRAPAPAPAKQAARPAAAPPPASEEALEDSGMLKLEFLAEPPVVQPAANPSAVAKKLHAASKAAEVAPTRAPRPLPAPVARASTSPAKPKAPAPAAKAAPPVARGPASAPAPAPSSRNPFEPVPAHSRATIGPSNDDVVVLFDSDPAGAPAAAAPPKAPPGPQARSTPPAKPAAQPTRVPAVRTAAVGRTATTARIIPAAPRPQPAARTPVRAPAPAPVATPAPAAPAAPEAAAVAPPQVAAPPASPPLDLIPFARLRAGGQTRRFQVQPRASASQRDPALDEQTVLELLAWLGANRALWNGVPTSFTVNLSIATLEDERFLTRIGAALNTHGIAGETLGFEIAESLCGQQRAKVERFITQCEQLGAWIAIDDFSFDSQVLPLLRSKALRMLKLDARLTAAALRDKLSQAMVVATVQAAKVLGIHCSAKKADSHASLQYLAAIGLDYAQGASPASAVALEAIATIPDSRAVRAPGSENT
jgi:EAL domain-containing protein (putative c-di-GMP-specific phosphodiesterase class I)